MATSHLCNGKWRPGPVSSCPKHKRLGRKQPSVYRTTESESGTSSSSSSGSDTADSPS